MEIGSGQGLTASQVWNFTPKLLSIGAGAIPSGSTQQGPNFSSALLTATGITNIIIASGTPGVLLSLGVNVNAALAGGVVTANIEYVVDGSLEATLNLYLGAITFAIGIQSIAQRVSGTGTSLGDLISYLMPIQFSTSLTVRVNVTATSLTTGAVQMSAMLFTHP